jgi:UDP-2-acetamido-3-amino-2,3-dideoxy-glucuronate N-acetyltransferase
VVGTDCNICDHVFIESDVQIGNRVTIKSGVQLWNGVRLRDDVFIGPNVTFTNDPFPRSRDHSKQLLNIVVEQGASIGANATILPGIVIGRNAMVGAGSVVTSDVPANAIVFGNPARITGYVNAPARIDSPSGSSPVTPENCDLGGRGVRLLNAPVYCDMRGSLAVTEAATLPFVPQRLFTVFSVPSKEVRGEHAHRQCEQLLTCVSGSVHVLWDDGAERGVVVLDHPAKSLYLPPMVWGSQYRFEAGTVLCVLASMHYDATDYIRTYEEFLAKLVQ